MEKTLRNAVVHVLAALAIGTVSAYACDSADASVHADHVGTTVRDIHGRRVGTVREIEYDCRGDARNVVIALGVLPGGGERYVVLPWHHLDDSRGALRFRGARERLVDAPRHAEEPARR
jgi:hypothetical protein